MSPVFSHQIKNQNNFNREIFFVLSVASSAVLRIKTGRLIFLIFMLLACTFGALANELDGADVPPAQSDGSDGSDGRGTMFLPRKRLKTAVLKARNGMLLSQVLRLFLAEHGYTLYYAAKYDCRLTASATLEGENINGVLRTFLHSFSLSAKINNNNNVVNVFAANSSAHICIPIGKRDFLSEDYFHQGEK